MPQGEKSMMKYNAEVKAQAALGEQAIIADGQVPCREVFSGELR